ncbi:MAG: HD domain-containing protein, partial [Deltaproteobacteria bacterium]|nr:HD domain-containing protein [Deltaproteobacteria bacterium]
MPDLKLASCAGMVLFDPHLHLPAGEGEVSGLPDSPCLAPPDSGFAPFGPVCAEGLGSLGSLPALPLLRASCAHPDMLFIPREEDCLALWNRYRMPEHIRRHSRSVADLAAGIADLCRRRGSGLDPEAVYAAGLLHDLAKGYCIVHGGNHAQLGAAWVMRETGNGPLAQGVLFHVYWPWAEDLTDDALLPLALIYADKRVMHDGYVSLAERFSDLLERYGTTAASRERITAAHEQGKRLEAALS